MAIPAGAHAFGVNTASVFADTAAVGISVSYVLAGTIGLHVDGPLLLAHTPLGETTGPLEPVPDGEPVTLTAGDVVVFPTDVALHIRNAGQRTATLISVLIVTTDAPAGEPQAVEDDAVRYQQLGLIDEDDWANVPAGPLTVSLQRTLLPQGATYGPYVVEPWAPELLSVETGLMEVGLDFDGDGMPDSWFAIQWNMTPGDMLAGERVRAIRAST